ncbi:von Willebrand factor A domain-containing protein 5A [Erinaceus europaeus]|uniref:von Willebrand factor A domain-containing protein 5A n=1 Tax=Erinaceus europaeus TaxID=9365 RepID=A0A1S3APW8_ERIEU|nr:von Willebrand factor A domain-containing protein 5A [Erinaceus europaeus]
MVLIGGLLTRHEEPVPLKSISVSVSICEFVAGVSSTLNYENQEKVSVEAFFVFPMDEDSAVYTFEAVVDGKRILAEIQDRFMATAMYENALTQGYQAFMLEEDMYSKDVFCCSVGYLAPGAKVALTLRYVQELPLEADGALRFVLPAVLNPRYQLSGSSGASCLNMKTPVVALSELPYTFSLVGSIHSQRGIEKIQSNSALNPIEFPGDDRTSAEISLADGHKFDRDVELLIYYKELHTPSVSVELGKSSSRPDTLMGAPSAMVCFYPHIPEAQPPITCGEFVFLMDRSGSMQGPLNNYDRSQLRIDAAKETLILLLKSLPLGCYFNVYGFGSTYESFFKKSVEYTQETMEEAVKRVKLMRANLGGTEILEPLQSIYSARPIPGHPRQLFLFTDGDVIDTYYVLREVQRNSIDHRCFSFGIGEGASTSLVKKIARLSGGTYEFITGKDRIQTKALRSLKRSLQPVVEDVSLSWNLPPGLSAKMLTQEQTVIFQGQRLILYAQLVGAMPPSEATGEVCLKYKFQGKNFENKVTFSLQPKFEVNLTVHRLGAKSFFQIKDMGFNDTPAKDKKDILQMSMESGVLSSHTSFIAINKDTNRAVQGPLVRRDIPRPMLLAATDSNMHSTKNRVNSQDFWSGSQKKDLAFKNTSHKKAKAHSPADKSKLDTHHSDFGETQLVQLISLQRADGSWNLNEGLAIVLERSLSDIEAALTIKEVDSSSWATVLAVLWLHTNHRDMKCEWELLERKAVTWIHTLEDSIVQELVGAAIAFLESSVEPDIFEL